MEGPVEWVCLECALVHKAALTVLPPLVCAEPGGVYGGESQQKSLGARFFC